METTLDRITLNFGTAELPLARALRQQAQKAGERQLNALIKRILREWLELHRT